MRMKALLAAAFAMLLGISTTMVAAPNGKAKAAPRTVGLTATDDMKFAPATIEARRGERVRVTIRTVSAMPKIAMAHNFVLLQKGVDAQALVTASALARNTDYLAPAYRSKVLSVTALAGGGETVQAELTAPATPGRYIFICTFPGHYQAGMKGVLIVK